MTERTMASDPAPTRTPLLVGSSATIVALLSMAMAMPAGGTLSTDARPAPSETASMREMAVAMVAAAAKNLLSTHDRLDAVLPAAPICDLTDPPRLDQSRLEIDSKVAHFRALSERLLDLPPPVR